jgi:hypothetical protein
VSEYDAPLSLQVVFFFLFPARPTIQRYTIDLAKSTEARFIQHRLVEFNRYGVWCANEVNGFAKF